MLAKLGDHKGISVKCPALSYRIPTVVVGNRPRSVRLLTSILMPVLTLTSIGADTGEFPSTKPISSSAPLSTRYRDQASMVGLNFTYAGDLASTGSSVVTHSASFDDDARAKRFSTPSSQETIHALGHMVPEVPP